MENLRIKDRFILVIIRCVPGSCVDGFSPKVEGTIRGLEAFLLSHELCQCSIIFPNHLYRYILYLYKFELHLYHTYIYIIIIHVYTILYTHTYSIFICVQIYDNIWYIIIQYFFSTHKACHVANILSRLKA